MPNLPRTTLAAALSLGLLYTPAVFAGPVAVTVGQQTMRTSNADIDAIRDLANQFNRISPKDAARIIVEELTPDKAAAALSIISANKAALIMEEVAKLDINIAADLVRNMHDSMVIGDIMERLSDDLEQAILDAF